MNKELDRYARNCLKEGLSICTDKQQLMFKRMYAKGNLELPINAVVEGMDQDKLENAMDQVSRTINK